MCACKFCRPKGEVPFGKPYGQLTRKAVLRQVPEIRLLTTAGKSVPLLVIRFGEDLSLAAAAKASKEVTQMIGSDRWHY